MLESGIDVSRGAEFRYDTQSLMIFFTWKDDYGKEYENETALYVSVASGQLETAQPLVDYGADVNAIRTEFILVVRDKKTGEIIEEYISDYDMFEEEYKDLEVFHRLVKEESVLELLISKGHKDFADRITAYTAGTKLTTGYIAEIRKYWNAKEYDPLHQILQKIDDARYCIRDTELMRNACFWTASEIRLERGCKKKQRFESITGTGSRVSSTGRVILVRIL